MPLVIQFHDGPSCPTIVCDACQEPIMDAKDGGYFFPRVAREEGRTVPIFFTCIKGRATEPMLASMGGSTGGANCGSSPCSWRATSRWKREEL
jgi:hypothetical protein